MLLVDVKTSLGITGKQAENLLHRVNITCNKNTIPGDTEKPAYASGIRIGTPAITTRGMKEKEIEQIAELIHLGLTVTGDAKVQEVKERVIKLSKKFKTTF
jgi:glycine hydroxymethyltransferase